MVLHRNKKPITIYLDDLEREFINNRTQIWGVTKSAAIKRILRESNNFKEYQSTLKEDSE